VRPGWFFLDKIFRGRKVKFVKRKNHTPAISRNFPYIVKADYYILLGESETGPWTLKEVQAFWQAGAVTLETLFAQPGMSEWKPLSAILDITSLAVVTPTPQSENSPGVSDADGTMDKPVEPEQMDLTKLRQWLRGKLAAIGFVPDSEEAETADHKFGDWLCRFTDNEQKMIFGANNIHRYRTGELTWQELLKQLYRLAVPTATVEKPKCDVKQLTREEALWIMEAVCGAEPRLELDMGKYRRMGAAEGGAGILKQRADTIAKQLKITP